MQETKFDFHDILIQPASQTDIYSRKTINPFYDGGYLPIITAPMDTVVSNGNTEEFFKNKINVCLPRGAKNNFIYDNVFKLLFESYSIQDYVRLFLDKNNLKPNRKVLIDVANGHMEDIYQATKKTKELYGNKLTLMVGNVANPITYKMLSEAGADYIRCGIGNGGGCLTTEQTGIGYPMASLISDCYKHSLALKKPAKIVADGGMKTYSDIIKALAIGADYVMIGSIFNKALESSGPIYWKGIPLGQHKNLTRFLYNKNFKLTKKFRGMSTKEVQREWGNEELKTSEGVIRFRTVEYTLEQWVSNFEHYLRSAMSYTNASSLSDFIGKVDYNVISQASYKRFNK